MMISKVFSRIELEDRLVWFVIRHRTAFCVRALGVSADTIRRMRMGDVPSDRVLRSMAIVLIALDVRAVSVFGVIREDWRFSSVCDDAGERFWVRAERRIIEAADADAASTASASNPDEGITR